MTGAQKFWVWFALVFGLVMFVAGFIITAIQFYYTVHYLRAVFANAGVDALKAVATLIPAWSRRFMVDLALVAPGLFGFTGACVTLGAWRILRGKIDSEDVETYPFPRPYRIYYINHGLLGTVCGFVIGFWNLDPQSSQAPTVMLAALGAALWSTLTAIALAYFLCPIIEWFFQSILIRGTEGNTDEDPLTLLDQRALGAAAALELFTSTVSAGDTTLALRRVSDELLSVRRDLAMATGILQSSATRISSLETNLKSANDEIRGLRTVADEKGRAVENLKLEVGSLRKEVGACEALIRQELEPLRNRLEKLEHDLTGDQQRRRNELVRVVQTFEQLHKSLDA